MFKFNNNHIFTGYLKQLLASFNLPKCRVYTKEQEALEQKYQVSKHTIEPQLKNLYAQQDTLSGILQEISMMLKNATVDSSYKIALQEIRAEYSKEYNAVTTKLLELQQYLPKIIPTVYHSEYLKVYPGDLPDDLPLKLNYPSKMRYAPYIKEGYLQVYADGKWHTGHRSFHSESSHHALHIDTAKPYAKIPYSYGQKILNYTKNLQIQNTIYDSYTHEYLGDYLRFQRDFANINLMPLYNCFSNRACPRLDLTFTLTNGYEVKFKTDQSFETTLYKYYMVPVKFFKDYTIAIDSDASIELCCCVYDEYQNIDTDFADIPRLTYQCFSDLQFKTPVLYTKLQNLTKLLIDPYNENNDLCQQEDNLKLILKIPVNNTSSIVILEGDYTKYNDSAISLEVDRRLSDRNRDTLLDNDLDSPEQLNSFEILAQLQTNKAEAEANSQIVKQTNQTVINYDKNNFTNELAACNFLADKLITPLQLLRTNTGESYPFADRLVEYLTGNAITVNEEIKDNVVRAKTVIGATCEPKVYPIIAEDGIWEPVLQCLAYSYINENHNTYDVNHDILGFIDKDVEKWYSMKAGDDTKTIANIDIYND